MGEGREDAWEPSQLWGYVSVRVLQRIKASLVHIDILWSFITGTGSHDGGGWEVPRSAVDKLEAGKSCGVIQSESEGPRTRIPSV